MKNIIRYLLTSVLLVISILIKAQTGLEVIQQVIDKNKTIKTLKITIEGEERVKNKYIKSKMRFKVNISPLRVYVYQYYPDEKLEVLFLSGFNNNKAYVRKNRLFKLYLDPTGSLMRKNSHNTLFKTGFNWTVSVIENAVRKYGDKASELVVSKGLVKLGDGRICYKIEMEDPDFKFINYTIKKGETLSSIAFKNFISDYMILENNPSVGFYDDVKEGDVIKIPVVYAKKTIMYIDKSNMLPALMMIYDDKGLFEKYTYSSVEINPVFEADEFTTSFKEYDF
jgi:hypothetical protein